MVVAYLISYSVLLITLILDLFTPKKQLEYSVNDNVPSSGYTTTDNSILKEILKDTINTVKNDIDYFTPYNSNILDVISQNIELSNDLNSISSLSYLIPNNTIPTKPLKPLSSPSDALVFQFEQGKMGWYWGYSSFISENKEPMNIMFYIIHVDIANPSIRKKYNLIPQETSSYYVSAGVGKGKEWHYTPYKYVRGKYDIFSKCLFRFETLDDEISCVFESLNELTFNLDIRWKESGKIYGFKTSISSIQQPYFNGKNGCCPCIEGIGTLYFSYTHLHFNNTLLIFDENIVNPDVEGTGGMDVQWMRTYGLKTRFMESVVNISLYFKNTIGLGRYSWNNIHVDNGDDYIIYSILKQDVVIEKNTIIDNAFYNIYCSSEDPQLNIKTTITVLDIVTIDNTVFPIKYSINIKDRHGINHIYIVDSTPFGNTVTIDNTSNLHWSGSAIVYENNIKIGTGFLESNQFQDIVSYVKNIFENNKLIGDYNVFITDHVLTLSQITPSITLLSTFAITFILWLSSLYDYITSF